MPFQIASICFHLASHHIAKAKPRYKFAKKFDEIIKTFKRNQILILGKGDYSKITEACNTVGVPIEQVEIG